MFDVGHLLVAGVDGFGELLVAGGGFGGVVGPGLEAFDLEDVGAEGVDELGRLVAATSNPMADFFAARERFLRAREGLLSYDSGRQERGPPCDAYASSSLASSDSSARDATLTTG
ncbi:MAG: hypothetical protein ACRCYU_14860 [Nocardioides sp.]